jgi:hypothetical protein
MRKPSLFLKCHERFKNGKEHRYWSLAENQRCPGGRIAQRQVLYLGEIAEAELDKAALKELLAENVGPQAKREAVTVLMTERDFGVTRACGLLRISLDRLGKNRTNWNVSFATKSGLGGRRFCREEEAVFGRADYGDSEAGRLGYADPGAVSGAWGLRAELLPLEEDLRRHGALGGP